MKPERLIPIISIQIFISLLTLLITFCKMMSKTSMKVVPLLLLVFFVTINVNAQKKQLEVYELFDVSLEDLLNVGIVSASKKKQSVTDAPATGYVVTEQNIKVRGYNNLLDLLRDIPEVEIQTNSDKEFKNLVTIRGVSGNEKFLILMDGIRITPATGDGYTFGTQFSLANAQRVEVIIGPASALYGVDAFSGIVNIISKTAEGKKLKGGEVHTSYGMYNTTDNSFVAGGKLDKVQLSLCGQFYHSDEVDLQNKYEEDFSWYNKQYQENGLVVESPFFNDIVDTKDFERWAGDSYNGSSLGREMKMPTTSYFLSADLRTKDFTLGLSRMHESHSSATGLDPRYSVRDKDAKIASTQNNVYVQHHYTSFNKKWRLNSTLRMNNFEYDPNSNFASASSRWQRGYVYTSSQSTKLQEQFEYDFSKKLSMILGGSMEFLNSTPRTGLSSKPFNPKDPTNQSDLYYIGAAGYGYYLADDEQPEFDGNKAIIQDVFYLNYNNYGAYGQVQWNPIKEIETTIGTRFDYNTRFGGSVNPRVGVVYKPNKKIRAKVLYGEAFLAPSPAKAFSQDGSFYDYQNGKVEADYVHLPNSDLKPEKLRSLELSGSYMLLDNLSLAVNGYHTKIENLIDLFAESDVTDPEIQGKPITASRVETSKNKGTSTITGGTFRLNYLLKLPGNVAMNFYGAYSYIDGDTDDEKLLYVAQNTVKTGVDIMQKKWSIAPRVRFRGESLTSLTDGVEGEQYQSPSFTVMDVMIRYNLIQKENANLSVYVRVDNVTNLKYYNVNVGSDEGFALTPQDPMKIMGGVNYAF